MDAISGALTSNLLELRLDTVPILSKVVFDSEPRERLLGQGGGGGGFRRRCTRFYSWRRVSARVFQADVGVAASCRKRMLEGFSVAT